MPPTLHLPPTDDALCTAIGQVLPEASAAWLFGSAANGNWQPGSDLDIAVAMRPSLDAPTRLTRAQALGTVLNQDVDLLDFYQLHTLMQVQVVTTGRLLFAHDAAQLTGYIGQALTEYQHLQHWRQPMVDAMATRMAQA